MVDRFRRALVLRASYDFKILVRFQARRLGVCETFKLRLRHSAGVQQGSRAALVQVIDQ